jgi:VanZ family protein
VSKEEKEAFLRDISGVTDEDAAGEVTGERLRGTGHISGYLGMSAIVVGSWVIVFGSVFI